MGHSPQRTRWVTEPEEIEPRPGEFSIVPSYNDKGILSSLTILDPGGAIIRKRVNIIDEIHKQFPGVTVTELNDARISYYEYSAIVELRRRH